MRKQKFLAMLLTLAMLLPMLPMFTMETSAAVAADEDVIRLPITIHDFKEDGIFMQIRTSLSPGMVATDLNDNGVPQYTERAIDTLAERINATTTSWYPGMGGSDTTTEIEQNVLDEDLENLLLDLYESSDNWNDVNQTWNPENAVDNLEDATTACQVADWILRNCFVDSSYTYSGNKYDYAKLVPEYDTLVLRKGTYKSLATGKAADCYYYNSGYSTSGNTHPFTMNTLFNRSSEGGGEIYNDLSGESLGSGGYFPLDKAIDDKNALGFGQETSGHNYHMSTSGSGQFVYHKAEDLFFAFHGDDDVLLFINGQLVIDDSGIHDADRSEIYLESSVNETAGDHFKVNVTASSDATTWAEYLGLEEGKLYRFDFFQMERNRTQSNFSMYTNMNVVDSSAVPQKKAYLNGQELTYGAFVPEGSEITYGLSLTNSGVTTITNLTFVDSLLGVNLNETAPVIDKTEANQPLTKYEDLEYALYETGKTAAYSELTEDVLKSLLKNGLQEGYTLDIRGFKYNVGTPVGEATTKTIPNTVQITAIGPSRNNPNKMVTLQGFATMCVRTLQIENVTFVMDYAKKMTLTNEDVFGNELKDLSETITVTDETSTTEVTLADKVNGVQLDRTVGDYGNLEMLKQADGTTTDGVTYPVYNFEYTPTKFLSGIDAFLINIDIKSETTYSDNKTDTSEYLINKAVNIIPANNVYYEDSFVTNTDTGVVGITFSDSFKTVVGTETNNTENAENDETTANGGVHGWENVLADDTTYSGGAAHMATEKGATATFTFKGTGVDIYSYTDINSGLVTAKIESTTTGSNFAAKYLMVDNLAISGSYYDVPTLSFTDLTYDEYKVTLTVSRAKAVEKDANGNIVFDENGNPSYLKNTYRSTYYLDGIRVYNPLGSTVTDNTVIDGYLGDGTHTTVEKIDTVFKAVNDLLTDDGLVFTDTVGGKVAVADYYSSSVYNTYGPKNEVYLAQNQAVTFGVTGGSEYYVGLKSLTGAVTKAEVTNGSAKAQYDIAHSTDLYYKVVPTEDGKVTIQNTGAGILALTKVQAIAITADAATPAAVSFMAVGEEEAANYVATFASLRVESMEEHEEEIPEVTPEEEVPEVPEIEVEIENPEPEQKPVVNNILQKLVKNLFNKIFGWFGR